MFKKTASFLPLAILVGLAAGLLAAYADSGWVAGWAVFLLVLLVGMLSEASTADPEIIGTGQSKLEGEMPIGFGRAMLRGMPSPLLVLARSGRLIYANDAAKALVAHAVPGAHISNIFRAPEFVAALNRALTSGQGQTVAFNARLGTERLLEAQIGLLPRGNDFGITAHAILQIEDRTEARRVESLRRDFIANASHELRTPLASIIGYIETLRGAAADDPEAQAEFLDIMARQADRMQRLVDDLMSLSRIELNEHQRPDTRCDLTEIASECARALAPASLLEAVDVTLPDPLVPAFVVGDRDQLQQVMTNLIDNAIKYSGQGGAVTLALVRDASRYPGMTGLRVSDTGPGIPRELIPRLTERFYRVNIAKSRDKGGTGLGLAIVKHILNRHGGRLDIESTLGKGSQFTIWIPSYPDKDPDPIPE